MPGRRLYLAGSSGHPNYGDELIAASWLRHLRETEPDAEVWLDCPSPGGAQLVLGDLHPNVRFVDTLFRIGAAAPSDEPEEVTRFAAQAVRQPGFGYAHRASGVELLHSADVYHVIGGGFLNGAWPRHLAVLAAAQVLTDEFGIRSAVTGQNLTPAPAPTPLLDELTAPLAVVDLADQPSRALLSGEDVTVTGDDALLTLGGVPFDPRPSPSTMMCLQSDMLDVDVEALAATALGTAQAWGLRGDRVGYVEAIPGQDRVVFDLIEPQLPGMRFYPFTEVWREGLPARRGQRWLTTRAHLHLVAAAAGAWGVAIPTKTGYSDVRHQELIDRGSRWVMGAPGQAAPALHGEAGFGRALEAQLDEKRRLAQRVYER